MSRGENIPQIGDTSKKIGGTSKKVPVYTKGHVAATHPWDMFRSILMRVQMFLL